MISKRLLVTFPWNVTNGISQCGTLRDTRVFPILELEFSEFMESDQSLKYELGQSKDSLLGCKHTELQVSGSGSVRAGLW